MVVFSYYPNDPRVRREAEALIDAGMMVDVICLKREIQSERELAHGVQIYRINLKRRRATKLRNPNIFISMVEGPLKASLICSRGVKAWNAILQ